MPLIGMANGNDDYPLYAESNKMKKVFLISWLNFPEMRFYYRGGKRNRFNYYFLFELIPWY